MHENISECNDLRLVRRDVAVDRRIAQSRELAAPLGALHRVAAVHVIAEEPIADTSVRIHTTRTTRDTNDDKKRNRANSRLCGSMRTNSLSSIVIKSGSHGCQSFTPLPP